MEYMFTEGSGSSWGDESDCGSSSEGGCHMAFEGEVSRDPGCEEDCEDSGFYHSASEAGIVVCGKMHVLSDHPGGEEVSVQDYQRYDVLQEAPTEGESVIEGPWNPTKHKCDYPSQWIRADGCVYPKFRARAREFLAFHRSLYHLQRGDNYWIHDDEKHVRPMYPPGLPWVTTQQANTTYCYFYGN